MITKLQKGGEGYSVRTGNNTSKPTIRRYQAFPQHCQLDSPRRQGTMASSKNMVDAKADICVYDHNAQAMPMSDDEKLLAQLGYKQEFKREFSTFATICYTTSVMGVVASFSATLNFPLENSGHVGIFWAWLLGSVMVWSVAASMAEMSSAMPTSGGLYYFAARLAPKGWGALASWYVLPSCAVQATHQLT